MASLREIFLCPLCFLGSGYFCGGVLVHHQVFVYGTLLAGEVNHHLLGGGELRGTHRTEPCFTMFSLGAYPGVTCSGRTAISGEIYRVDASGLKRLDRLEDYPRLYDRVLIPSPFGRAWIYLYKGRTNGCQVIGSGDWRSVTEGPNPLRDRLYEALSG